MDRRGSPEFKIELEGLLKLQREDGSWPFNANIGYPSSVFETAWSLEALADASESESKVIQRAANWLFGQQKERGSWGEVKDLKGLAPWWMTPGRSSHATTSAVVAALARQGIGKDDERVSLGLEYFCARQFRAGSWGWRFPHAWGTVSVLRAFALASEGEDSPAVKRGLDFMLSNTDRYGFWWCPGATSLFMHVYLLLGYMLDDPLLQRCIIYLVRIRMMMVAGV
ncbi:MAG: Prenyltransferase and squalene oxidase repeat protein [Candidatus Bathyarchaeota archaeon BA1]|nr:MAG: Prenyltransferase and squalene oxidase repeat protein [Candidatus Bathyarchaeota archaeon BA1]